jgi:hypothetical protein
VRGDRFFPKTLGLLLVQEIVGLVAECHLDSGPVESGGLLDGVGVDAFADRLLSDVALDAGRCQRDASLRVIMVGAER